MYIIVSLCVSAIDKCALAPNICGHGTCVSVQTGYTCSCDPGYKLSALQTNCIGEPGRGMCCCKVDRAGSHTHRQTLILSPPLSISLTLTHLDSQTPTPTYTDTHTHRHTYTHTLTLSLSSLSPSPSIYLSLTHTQPHTSTPPLTQTDTHRPRGSPLSTSSQHERLSRCSSSLDRVPAGQRENNPFVYVELLCDA